MFSDNKVMRSFVSNFANGKNLEISISSKVTYHLDDRDTTDGWEHSQTSKELLEFIEAVKECSFTVSTKKEVHRGGCTFEYICLMINKK